MHASPLAHRLVALLIATGCLVAIGCEHNVYEIHLKPQGDKLHRELTVWKQGQENDAPKPISAGELERLGQVYGQKVPAADKGKQQFAGDFARRTPADVGGSGWYTRWESPFGTVTAYLEQFRGRDDLAEELKHRQAIAGKVVDFFRDWLAKEVGDDPRADKVRAFLDGEFRHDIENLVLYVWTYEIAAASSDKSPDKVKAGEFAMRLLAYFGERGYVSPETLPAWVRAVGGNEGPTQVAELLLKVVASKSGIAATERWPEGLERLRDYDTLHRSLVKALRASDLPALADKIAAEEEAPLLRSKDVTEEDKADGTMMVLFIQIAAPSLRFTNDQLQLRYHAARPPLATNGDWKEDAKTVNWNGPLTPDAKPRQPPYTVYAVWATPDEEAQKARFGKVVLKDQALGDYCLWYAGLSSAERREWDMLIARLQPRDDHRSALEAFRFTGEEERAAKQENKRPLSSRARDLISLGL